MAQEKSSNKVKIFLFLIFAILMVAFLSFTLRIFRDLFVNIASKNEEMKCNNFNYIVNEQDYSNNRLVIDLMSQSYDSNITKLTLIPDNSDKEYTKVLENPLAGGGSASIIIEDIRIERGFYTYVENCDEMKKYELISG